MAGSVNKVLLIGHVGRDPEIRQFSNGGEIALFTLATSENWRDKQSGERRSRTSWHRIAIHPRPLVDLCRKYVRKGSKLALEGQIETRKWTDKNGQDRYTTEVVLRPYRGQITLLGRPAAGKETAAGDSRTSAPTTNEGRPERKKAADTGKPDWMGPGAGRVPFDDDLPF